MMDLFANQAAAYPRWVVVSSLVITACVFLWFFLKVCKWMFMLAVFATLLVVIGGLAFWYLA